jgi:hypothetical protein
MTWYQVIALAIDFFLPDDSWKSGMAVRRAREDSATENRSAREQHHSRK